MNARAAIVFLSSLLILVGIGAGCTPATAPEDSAPEDSAPAATEQNASIIEKAATEQNASIIEKAATETVVAVSETAEKAWQKYSNAALGFAFEWPNAGRYAPRWEVKFPADAEIKDGCYGTEGMTISKFMAGEQEFCHASGTTGNVATDYYVTKIGARHVVLSFTKDSTGAGKDFSWDEYRKQLDSIVATFKAAK